MAAFHAAVALGYRYLETDVHRTSDGVLVAFHDDRLDRVTDRSGIVSELTWDEVRQARVGGTEPIPLLDDLLDAFPDARFNLDPKHDAAVEPLAAAITAHGALDRVCIAAFSDQRIARAQELLGPRLCTSLGPRANARLVAASRRIGRARSTAGATQVPLDHRGVAVLTPRFIRAARRAGLQVHVWTIDQPDEMHRLLDLGVDGIMTDRAGVLREVLIARGQWPVR